MKLLELLFLSTSIYISFAGSPSYTPINSIIDESTLQSIVSSGPWITESVLSSNIQVDSSTNESSTQSLTSSIYSIEETVSQSSIQVNTSINETSIQSLSSSGSWINETVDTRILCITCYVLFKTNVTTTRNCNSNKKLIWELWYNVSGIQRGGYCIDFESLQNIEEIDSQITSVVATSLSIPNSWGSGSGVGTGFGGIGVGGGGSVGSGSTNGGAVNESTTIYKWSIGQKITVQTGILPDCIPCHDFLHLAPKLSPFECNPGNAMKIKVTYEVSPGKEEMGYCAGQITMSEKELRNIQSLFWTEKTQEPKCEECSDVLALRVNASKEFCDNGNDVDYRVQFYDRNWNLTFDGFCVYSRTIWINWNKMNNMLFAQVYRLNLKQYYYWMRDDATEIEKTSCQPCAKLIYEHKTTTNECKSNGKPLWQVWFNTTYESYAGYCIDFLEMDLNLIADNYIMYILATNQLSTYEWVRSGSEVKKVTEIYPPCVNCSEVVNGDTHLSSFYCDPGNQTKVRVYFTDAEYNRFEGYCAGFYQNYTVNNTLYNPNHAEMYYIHNTYTWNEKCVNCYDVFVSGANVSRSDCEKGNETVFIASYTKRQYTAPYQSYVYGFCVKFNPNDFDDWNLQEDIFRAYIGFRNYSQYWERNDCVHCYSVLVSGRELSPKNCLSGTEQQWHISYSIQNIDYKGYCKGLEIDNLDSWGITDNIENLVAKNGTESFTWQRPIASPEECVSCYDAIVYGSSLSTQKCNDGNEQRWFVTYTDYNSNYYEGYCIGIYPGSFYYWNINPNIKNIHVNNGIETYYYENPTSSESYTPEPLQCVTCFEILLYRSSLNPDCDPQGQILWDIWFNSTDAFTDGGFCVNFMETDFNGIGEAITYIRASNGSSTVEWFKSNPEIKEVTKQFPPCVRCSDVANSNIPFSSLDCDSGYERKVRALYKNSLGEEHIGYCVGIDSYDYSFVNLTSVTLYDRDHTYFMPDSQNAT